LKLQRSIQKKRFEKAFSYATFPAGGRSDK
jgi:hypothetical protein